MLADLLNESCTLQLRTVDSSGMSDRETWADLGAYPCRVLTRSAVRGNVEKAKDATLLTTRFALPLACPVVIRCRLVHAGVTYPVIKVISPVTPRGAAHKIAVCEAVAGAA